MSDAAPDRHDFVEPRPTDKFLLQTTGDVVTYQRLLEMYGEAPQTEGELEAILEEYAAAAIVTKL